MGCDVLAPSDMMDGRIGLIRKELDKNKFKDIQIISADQMALDYEQSIKDAEEQINKIS